MHIVMGESHTSKHHTTHLRMYTVNGRVHVLTLSIVGVSACKEPPQQLHHGPVHAACLRSERNAHRCACVPSYRKRRWSVRVTLEEGGGVDISPSAGSTAHWPCGRREKA